MTRQNQSIPFAIAVALAIGSALWLCINVFSIVRLASGGAIFEFSWFIILYTLAFAYAGILSVVFENNAHLLNEYFFFETRILYHTYVSVAVVTFGFYLIGMACSIPHEDIVHINNLLILLTWIPGAKLLWDIFVAEQRRPL